MKEQTKILIAATKDQAEYDNACKNLFKNKEILAPVLKYAIGEYKDFTVEEIIGFIDGVSISIDTPVEYLLWCAGDKLTARGFNR